MKHIHLWLIAFGVTIIGCDRFETPTSTQCKSAVENLVSQSVGSSIDKEIGKPAPKDD